ncbi:recombinase family protein [Mesorhizobium sp. M4A.F.Ca.ET.022.05.2.1]|uniref:recombinase family protein n=1 Tax=Mesorhizobium sp. M4A.F.Ca.ET.022.05.2.1 TaxID=2496653 RepID=UPI000FCBA287|nr:recombinase family protein [Mesorhizobium sp. M4A.F.Ca.ET.022.05.2.1]RVC79307.1 recombinase family protein [Mesorhizobium sp. M4A.F.Ca.ET.022.05.2.1]
MKRAAVYLRVSTKEQTTDNQRLELERVAIAKGWVITATYQDEGISGAKGRDKRPGYDQLLQDAVRAKFDVLMAWDVSRLGRSLTGLVQALDDLHSNGVDLYLHQQAIDTTTPSGKAMFQMTGVFAEFERAMIQERVKVGLARAIANGKKLGRPTKSYNVSEIKADGISGLSIRLIAKRHNISVGKAHQIITTLSSERSKGHK